MPSQENEVSVLNHLRTLMDERFAALNKELGLYREEMKARLSGLNELRADVVKDRETLLTKVEFDMWVKERAAWRESINNRLSSIEATLATKAGASREWMSILSLVFSGVVLMVMLVHFGIGVGK